MLVSHSSPSYGTPGMVESPHTKEDGYHDKPGFTDRPYQMAISPESPANMVRRLKNAAFPANISVSAAVFSRMELPMPLR